IREILKRSEVGEGTKDEETAPGNVSHEDTEDLYHSDLYRHDFRTKEKNNTITKLRKHFELFIGELNSRREGLRHDEVQFLESFNGLAATTNHAEFVGNFSKRFENFFQTMTPAKNDADEPGRLGNAKSGVRDFYSFMMRSAFRGRDEVAPVYKALRVIRGESAFSEIAIESQFERIGILLDALSTYSTYCTEKAKPYVSWRRYRKSFRSELSDVTGIDYQESNSTQEVADKVNRDIWKKRAFWKIGRELLRKENWTKEGLASGVYHLFNSVREPLQLAFLFAMGLPKAHLGYGSFGFAFEAITTPLVPFFRLIGGIGHTGNALLHFISLWLREKAPGKRRYNQDGVASEGENRIDDGEREGAWINEDRKKWRKKGINEVEVVLNVMNEKKQQLARIANDPESENPVDECNRIIAEVRVLHRMFSNELSIKLMDDSLKEKFWQEVWKGSKGASIGVYMKSTGMFMKGLFSSVVTRWDGYEPIYPTVYFENGEDNFVEAIRNGSYDPLESNEELNRVISSAQRAFVNGHGHTEKQLGIQKIDAILNSALNTNQKREIRFYFGIYLHLLKEIIALQENIYLAEGAELSQIDISKLAAGFGSGRQADTRLATNRNDDGEDEEGGDATGE
ncbi:MAG: hypothetical protein AAF551_10915, partial [Bacteroidota bacterium]